MNRRVFLQGLLAAAGVVAAPKIFIDMAPAWHKHDELWVADALWTGTDEDLASIFKAAYKQHSENLYSSEPALFRKVWGEDCDVSFSGQVFSVPIIYGGLE